jgi:hypothetical protein
VSLAILLIAAQMTPRLYLIFQVALKIILTHVPVLAKLERWEISSTRHPLDLFAAASENFCKVLHIEHLAGN